MSGVGQAKTLAELLKNRRLDLKGSNKEVTQPEIALAIKQSQAQVWKIENNQTDITKWFPERQLALLRAYRFSNDEIHEIAEKFKLDIPNVKNPTSENPTTLDKLPSRTITAVGAGGYRDVNVTDFATAGRKLEDVIQVHAENGILSSREVNVPAGAFVYFDKTQSPAPGKTVLYQVRGHDRFIMLSYRDEIGEQFVTSFDGKTGMRLLANDPPLDLLGVMFAMTSFEPKD